LAITRELMHINRKRLACGGRLPKRSTASSSSVDLVGVLAVASFCKAQAQIHVATIVVGQQGEVRAG
jgi:hypothetical protein